MVSRAVSNLLERYMRLDQAGKYLATYVWIDGTGQNLRGKTRTLPSLPQNPSHLPMWNFDGSSTGQSTGNDSDVYLRPVSLFKDPFLSGDNVLVMCDTLNPDGSPTLTNNRVKSDEAMSLAEKSRPWFGMEQEYTLLDVDGMPYGWPRGGYPGPQGPYYCAVGPDRVFGRAIMDSHYKACLYAGVQITGTNVEVMPSQFEYQVGPCEGTNMADQLWMSRYILHRVAEEFGVCVSLDPKPVTGDWNGAGAHVNFSTAQMRADGGIGCIRQAIEMLEKQHSRHIKYYDPNGGKDNMRRLTGLHETSDIHTFSSGIAHRGASIRIPRQVSKDQKGYLEDRRPSANCDPYKVTEALIRTIVLENWHS